MKVLTTTSLATRAHHELDIRSPVLPCIVSNYATIFLRCAPCNIRSPVLIYSVAACDSEIERDYSVATDDHEPGR